MTSMGSINSSPWLESPMLSFLSDTSLLQVGTLWYGEGGRGERPRRHGGGEDSQHVSYSD